MKGSPKGEGWGKMNNERPKLAYQQKHTLERPEQADESDGQEPGGRSLFGPFPGASGRNNMSHTARKREST